MGLKQLLLLALIPSCVSAQEIAAPKPGKSSAKTEFAFNLGHALDNAYNRFGAGGYLRGSLSLLKNNGRFQYGVTVEGGTNSNDFWYTAPGVVANYRSSLTPCYWYAGAMAGYNLSGYMSAFQPASDESGLRHGYVFGLQTGYVQRLGKRFALNGEIGVRSSQNRIRANPYQLSGLPYGAAHYTEVTVSVPVTIGIRYSL